MGESVSITKENKTYQKIFTVSSLDKVFPKEGPNLLQNEYTIFKNETFHFQVSFYFTHITNVKIFVRSDLEKYITVRSVESIPARFARYEGGERRLRYKRTRKQRSLSGIIAPVI